MPPLFGNNFIFVRQVVNNFLPSPQVNSSAITNLKSGYQLDRKGYFLPLPKKSELDERVAQN